MAVAGWQPLQLRRFQWDTALVAAPRIGASLRHAFGERPTDKIRTTNHGP